MLSKAPFSMNAAMTGMMNRTMKKVDGVVWDLMTGIVGIKTKDSIRTLDILDTTTDAEGVVTNSYGVKEDLLAMFAYTIPAFAIAKPIELVQPGELIVFKDNNTFGWVTRNLGATVDVIKGDGTSTNYRPNKVNMVGAGGANTVLVVTSLMGMFPQGQETAGLGNLQGMLLPMLMLGNEGGDDGALDKMLPLLLMSTINQGAAGVQGQAAGGMNPMMLMMLMNKDKGGSGGGLGDIDPMMLMMMSGGMGGGAAAGGMNPMMMMALMGKNSPFA